MFFSISDTKSLKNGYRFIKEMMLQNHNHSMNVAYEKLKQHDIYIYTGVFSKD